MLNRALAKLVLIAFWWTFFQCQVVSTVSRTPNASAPHSRASHAGGFCKRKLTDGKDQVNILPVRQKVQTPPGPPISPDYVDGFVRYLVRSSLPVSPTGSHFATSSAHWLMVRYRANPNKAPPVCRTAQG